MDKGERKLRYLEGFGYVAAVMIAVGGLTDTESLKYFNVFGLVFAVIVIIRLMVMNINLGLVGRLYEPLPTMDSDFPDDDLDLADEEP